MYEINYSWEEKVLLPSYTLPSLNFPSFLSLRRSHEIVEHISVITYHLFFNFPSILPLSSSFTRELIWNKKRTYKCKCLDRYTSNFLSFFFSIAGDLFVVVFSLDCRESFEEAIRLRESILETKVSATQSATKSRSKSHFNLKVPMVIVGNKCDKDTKYVSLF